MKNVSVFVIFLSCMLFGDLPEKYEYLIPKQPIKKPGRIINLYDEEEKKSFSEDDKILVESLKQLILVAYDQEPTASKQGQVVFSYNLYVPQKEKLRKELQPYIGLPVTMRRLHAITTEIENYYKQEGYALVLANLQPDQDISDGSVIISVVIARLGNVKAEGAKYFSNEKIAKQIRTKKGTFIQTDQMISDLSWINTHSFYSTNLVYEKGENVGETDVLLKTHDRFPLRPYIGYENTGNPTVGVNRYFIGVNWGKAWMLDDHELNYQFTMANDPNRWLAHSGSYQIFLPWRNRLQAFGFYSRAYPEKPFTVNLKGKSWQISGRYLIPWIKWKIRNQFTIGYDFKRTNNYLEFNQLRDFLTFIEVSQFLFTYDGQYKDPFGLTSFGLQAVLSPGNMTPKNTDAQFQQERAGSRADYVYSRFFLERYNNLFWGLAWYLKASMQLSSAKLLPSEEMSIAGYLYVRGYYENEIIGDEGYLIKNELRFPSFTIKKKKTKTLGDLQFLAFVDYGKVWDADPNILNRKSSSLVSIGPGLRYNLLNHITARVDWAFRFKQPHTYSRKHYSMFNAGVVASY